MIKDRLSNSYLYANMHPLFAEAFSYLHTVQPDNLHTGELELKGRDVFAIRSTAQGKEHGLLESHKKYIDIQYLVAGSEWCGWKSTPLCKEPAGDFDTAKDIVFYNDSFQQTVELEPGEFVIFFPEDAHAPMLGEGEITKVIIKVLNE